MTRQTLRSRTAFAVTAFVFALSACHDKTAPKTPAAINPVGTGTFTGVVGDVIPTPLNVKVTDQSGSPVSGTVVTFTVAEGGGSVSPAIDTTDDSGVASTTWRLGERTGVAQRVTAAATGLTTNTNFLATTTAAAPSIISVSAGDNQTGAAGSLVATVPAVLLKDKFGNTVPGVSVFFTVSAGGGTVNGSGATTNANGIASPTDWRLGSVVGTNRLTALAVFNGVSGNPITFTATGTAGAAASIAPSAGGGTAVSAAVGALVSPAPGVRVLDANGNPVVGASVTFAGSAGSNVVGATKSTDANGVATIDGWQLGTVAQTYTLTATVGTLPSLVFTATARPGNPASVSISAGNSQSVIAGRTVPIEPAVRVSDSFNNPIVGVEVVFDVISGGGSAVSRRPLTNASGIATVGAWTLGEDVGTNTLRATVTATGVTGNPVTFTATGTPGIPVSVTAVAGASQTAIAGSTVPISPSVIVRDNRGNPINGATVTFLIGSGGGAVVGGTALTSSTGVATVGSWTLGSTAGTQTLIARVANLPDVTFSATATAGAASTMTAVSTQALGSLVAAVGQTASPVPSVRITDVLGNPVAGVTVTFAVGNLSSGTLTGDTQVTNSSGIASLGTWNLPTAAGIISVIATAPGVTGVTFTATITSAVASQAVIVGSVQTTAQAGTAIPVTVRLQDQFGNNVLQAGTPIGFAAAGTGGSVSSASVSTNASGIALVTWTIGTAGAQTLTFSTTASGITVPAARSVTIVP